MKDLPTDEEFLESIYATERNREYVEEIKHFYDEDLDLEEEFRILVERGVYQPDKFEEFKALARETLTLGESFRGKFINVLKHMALSVLGKEGERLANTPVGLLPTRALNACVIATPRQGAIIILNHGVISQLANICRWALAFISWQSDEPFCRDSTQAEYAEALISLAQCMVTGDLRFAVRHQMALRFPSLGDYDETTTTFCVLMELFILLHEYGHIVCGHLSPSQLRPALDGQVSNLKEYSKSEQQEFEADQYAVDQLVRAGKASGLRPSDVAFSAGLLMKFFELCELAASAAPSVAPRTHPPARDRWEKIKERTHLGDATGALALNLDPAFEVILGRLQLQVRSGPASS